MPPTSKEETGQGTQLVSFSCQLVSGKGDIFAKDYALDTRAIPSEEWCPAVKGRAAVPHLPAMASIISPPARVILFFPVS